MSSRDIGLAVATGDIRFADAGLLLRFFPPGNYAMPIAEVLAGAVAGEGDQETARKAVEAEVDQGSQAAELLARLLGGDAAAAILADLEAVPDTKGVEARLRGMRGRAMLGDASALEDLMEAVQAFPRGVQGRLAPFAAFAHADVAAMTGDAAVGRVALQAARMVRASPDRDETVGVVARKLALRDGRQATTGPLVELALEAAATIRDTHEANFTWLQVRLAQAQVGDVKAARRGLTSLEKRLEDTPQWNLLFRARALAGFWEDAEGMLASMEEEKEQTRHTLQTIQDVSQLQDQMAGLELPGHLTGPIHDMEAVAHGLLRGHLHALGDAAMHGPPEARPCLERAEAYLEWGGQQARIRLAGTVLEDREAAERVLQPLRDAPPEGEGARLEWVHVLVRAAWMWRDDAALEEACMILEEIPMSKDDKAEAALGQLFFLAYLAEDERMGITGEYL